MFHSGGPSVADNVSISSLMDEGGSPAQDVYAKQDMPLGQSKALPDGHECVQDRLASPNVLPQKKDSGFAMEQVV